MLSDIWYIGRRLTCQVKIKPMLLKSSLLLRHQMLGKGRHVAQVKIGPFSHRSGIGYEINRQIKNSLR